MVLCIGPWDGGLRAQEVVTHRTRITPAPAATGDITFHELTANGENFIRFQAPAILAGDTPYIYPSAYPAFAGYVLSSDLSGNLSWVAGGGAPSGPAGGSLSGTYPNPALAATQPDAHTWNGLPKFTASAIIGSSGMTVPASAVDNLILEGGVAPSADPGTSGFALWADTTLGGAYRTGVTNEGDGITNALHNRFVEQYGTGGSYTLTTTSALINLGGNDPQVTVPSAGTWTLVGSLTVFTNSATFTSNRTVNIRFRRTNNTPANLTSSGGVECRKAIDTGTMTTETKSVYVGTYTCIYTTLNNNDIIALYGQVSALPTAGSIQVASVGSYMQAVRLF